jgi:cell wall-associated NlpC family hydrolase
MLYRRINPLKFSILIVLSGIVWYLIVYGLPASGEEVPEKHKTTIKDTMIHSKPMAVNISMRDSIVNFGMALLGTPYVEGASGKDGFDCSGFVYYVFHHFKIQVPRSSSQFEQFGNEASIDSLQRGDILVFLSPTRDAIGHLGIVINSMGMESDFIHASSGKEMKVIVSSLKQEGYSRRFVKAINVAGKQ